MMKGACSLKIKGQRYQYSCLVIGQHSLAPWCQSRIARLSQGRQSGELPIQDFFQHALRKVLHSRSQRSYYAAINSVVRGYLLDVAITHPSWSGCWVWQLRPTDEKILTVFNYPCSQYLCTALRKTICKSQKGIVSLRRAWLAGLRDIAHLPVINSPGTISSIVLVKLPYSNQKGRREGGKEYNNGLPADQSLVGAPPYFASN